MAAGSDEERSLEGWSPRIPDELTLAEAIELAFDYRGDVTLDLADGTDLAGYVFNRDADAAEPVVQLYVAGQEAPRTVSYAAVRAVRFTGRDTAAGNSYAAWLRRREAAREAKAPAPGPGGS
jgi:hypothetical protein